MEIDHILAAGAANALQALFNAEVAPESIQIQKTSKDFEGNLTIVVFPLAGRLRKNPMEVGNALGEYLVEHLEEVAAFNIVKGFLNLSISDQYWLTFLNAIMGNDRYGHGESTGELKMVEYSSPNTNKPLHLGHLRNNFLGYSMAEILKANGHDVLKVQIINDRGVHICMSMYAWKTWGEGETPASSGIKGDHLVGKYYVRFNQEVTAQTKAQLDRWAKEDFEGTDAATAEKYEKLLAVIADEDKAEKEKKTAQDAIKDMAKAQTPIMVEVRDMLRKWEAKDEATIELWKTMNGWCYEGFDATYKALGVDFDKLYYESDTYLLGRDIVMKGLQDGLFYQKEDGSIWVDLTEDGLDHKLLLRGDGTAVYMTQDIGTAVLRFQDYPALTQLTYTVANEQDYHFKVLFLILDKLGLPFAKECYHLSYGMMELPHGRMKSREGTVVDADNILEEMAEIAKNKTVESVKLPEISESELEGLFHQIGSGALKYFILKVDPRKTMVYNPEESIDFTGNTGPYIQYNYARTRSLLRSYGKAEFEAVPTALTLEAEERDLIQLLSEYPATLKLAGKEYSPAIVANYCYDLVKAFSSFWNKVPVLKAESEEVKEFRVALSKQVGDVVKSGMSMLGIEVPERM